jgi:hypothetical protein
VTAVVVAGTRCHVMRCENDTHRELLSEISGSGVKNHGK